MAEIRFEEALKRLERIVENLETGKLSLDQSLAEYEDGIKLIRLCQKKLEQARKKVELLVKTEDGKIKIEPFDNETKTRKGKDQ